MVKDDEIARVARSLIGESSNVDYVVTDYGDCWVRDTAPLFGRTVDGALGALCFDFNGWGGKYEMPFDDRVSKWMTTRLRAKRFESPIVLEGGALESNGQGTLLTTSSCVLNENRNPGLTRAAFEQVLRGLISMERLIWLDRGLEHDHTDGHIDMLARFVSPDTVVCMRGSSEAPNEEVLRSIEHVLRDSGLNVIGVPAPRAVFAPDGAPLPASYCNFYIANEAVLVPIYEIPEDKAALSEIASAFPSREVIGLPAADLLWGGGAFHCVTQSEPSAP